MSIPTIQGTEQSHTGKTQEFNWA